ncbi:substrate-binding domain-containing protein [Gramella sp. AN32]|uniref:Substrate-binding domain-containing protein n=1 Tax=Christiangramia antarctica TaxID=2058158 RepID=A0ABW5X094_9FLAO|nr:substrate-binding domain-containing protein [Gramella sp. AN32]MCM4156797.1 ABC transporter substrate-binding protein [Gramella sp. AN32]
MKTIRVAGVPEHFNLPWHIANENNHFSDAGINLEWIDVPQGTGAMCRALRENHTDVAVILTEGITRDIINGNESRIIQNFIKSPLIWGIHVAAGSEFTKLADLENTKAAISRKGSGSHLMAYVNAENEGWNIDDLQFEIVNNLDGAIKALQNNTAQYFMWEHFTTKPLVDNGTFRRLGDCPTPWPCFVIAARKNFIKNEPEALKRVLSILNAESRNFKNKTGVVGLLAKRYGQKMEDIRKWLKITEWSQQQISKQDIYKVQEQLMRLKLIDRKVDYLDIIHNLA